LIHHSFLAYFGSLEEAEQPEAETNFDTTSDPLCQSLAGDILQQLHGEIALEQKQSNHATVDGKPTTPLTASQPPTCVETNHGNVVKGGNQIGKTERNPGGRSRHSTIPA
jgi:hypothetical protein